jgi:hypothetical protein
MVSDEQATLDFAYGLRHYMQERRFGQTDLARAAGIVSNGKKSRPNAICISRYLNGESTPRLWHLRNIAEALRVSESKLLGFKAPKGAKLPANLNG